MREISEDEQLTFDILIAPPTTNIFLLHRQRNDKKWKCKNLEVLLMTEMETSHIQNAIAMLEKGKQEYTRAYRGLQKELKSRNIT